MSPKKIFIAWGYGGQFIYLIPKLNMIIVSTANTKKRVRRNSNLEDFIKRYIIQAIKN